MGPSSPNRGEDKKYLKSPPSKICLNMSFLLPFGGIFGVSWRVVYLGMSFFDISWKVTGYFPNATLQEIAGLILGGYENHHSPLIIPDHKAGIFLGGIVALGDVPLDSHEYKLGKLPSVGSTPPTQDASQQHVYILFSRLRHPELNLQGNSYAPPWKLTVRPCQEAFSKEKDRHPNHQFSGASW